ncbi:MAG: methionyl-tRNA formyltransferase [bacterium]|nr:methionyl-tRNA formyltransferase [bacterium]
MAEKNNYIFFGTPRFAAIALEELIRAGMPPTLVVANPDRPTGRAQELTPPPAKVAAEKAGIPVLQPEKIDAAFLEELKRYGANCYLVAAYGKLLPAELLAIPTKRAVGIHPSLLPRYRGSSPIQSAILEGEKETGVTLYLLDEKMDSGPVLAREEIAIGEAGYAKLEERLARMGAKMAVKVLPRYLAGELSPTPQDQAQATFTKKFKTEDGFVEIGKDNPGTIARKVRALSKEPGVYTIRDAKRLKLLAVARKNGAWIATRIQWEGKTPQSVALPLD